MTEPNGVATQYAYNSLNNVTQVSMDGQTRAFEYNSLGQVMKACNPESSEIPQGSTTPCTSVPLGASGLDVYTYDAAGNLKTRTDARGSTTTYTSYDGLNRLKQVDYTTASGTAATPTVTYTYDQDSKGALSSVGMVLDGKAYSTAYTYDGFGRVKTSTQTTADEPYVFQYTYSLTDQLTEMVYPWGRKVTYTPDAAGRIQKVQNGTTLTDYATIDYNASGAISSIALGNGVTEQFAWNDRSQLTGVSIGKALSPAALALGLYPCPGTPLATDCATGNTGNLYTQTIATPGLTKTQTYGYDALNRLTSASEAPSSWSLTFGLSNNGNQWVSAQSGYTLGSFTPTASTNFDGQNRLGIQNSSYDSMGNQQGIGVYRFTYDGAGRMATSELAGTTTYVYDGEGQRVMKQTATGTTVYVYDAGGNLAAESTTAATASACGTPTCYVSVDHLGSTRLVTDSAGDVVRRYDYYPYGNEILAGTGGRTTALGYPTTEADGFTPKFTGQVQDAAAENNGLYYFNARYYSAEQGRFVSVDPENAGADPGNPQTWNGYAYVGNNPLNITDPTGEGIFGDIFGFVGSFFGNSIFPGLGSLIGWGVGSVADAATGQSISPPGFNFGSAIFGSIAGSVNSGQPWNEQIPITSGASRVNIGSVFGSGNTGPFVFSATITSANTNPALFSNLEINRVYEIAGVVFTVEAIGRRRDRPAKAKTNGTPTRTTPTQTARARIPPWSTCLFAPHDFVQAFYAPKQAPDDPLVGNGNATPWQSTTRGNRQIGDPNGLVLGGGLAGGLNIFANTFADCSLRLR